MAAHRSGAELIPVVVDQRTVACATFIVLSSASAVLVASPSRPEARVREKRYRTFGRGKELRDVRDSETLAELFPHVGTAPVTVREPDVVLLVIRRRRYREKVPEDCRQRALHNQHTGLVLASTKQHRRTEGESRLAYLLRRIE